MPQLSALNNMNRSDRAGRAILGAVLIAISLTGEEFIGDGILGVFALLFGAANILAAVTGWCFMYAVIGLSSRDKVVALNEASLKGANYQTLRNRSVLGYAAVAVAISLLFMAESYDTSKDIIRRMELAQLHDTLELVSDEVIDYVEEEKIPWELVHSKLSSETLRRSLYHFNKPMTVGIYDGTKWISASKVIAQEELDELLELLHHKAEKLIGQTSGLAVDQHAKGDFYDLERQFIDVQSSQYSYMIHPLNTDNKNPVWLLLAQRSDSAKEVFSSVLTRLSISSIVVIWLAIWGAVGISYFIWQYIDASNRRIKEAARTDSQTNLLNERALFGILEDLTTSNPGASYSVTAAKFRNLSTIVANNSSQILSRLLNNLATELKASLSQECTLLRLNDGSFVLISPEQNAQCVNQFREITRQVQRIEDYQFSLEPTEVTLTYPADVSDADGLVSAISTLTYIANQRRQSAISYSEGLIQQSFKISEYAASIKDAIELQQFELYFQPKIALSTRQIVGVEALVRWNHPQDGLLSPASFLEIVDHSNHRSAFARYVLEESYKAALKLRSVGMLGKVSFNLSGYDLLDEDVISSMETVARLSSIPVHNILEVELVESETTIDVSVIRQQLERISEMGYSIALDDFGTGMSSLSFSHQLPIDTIKIDRSFVTQLTLSQRSQLPIRTALDLAKNYGYSVVVEGVETEEQATILKALGATVAQGYYFAKPMPLSKLESYVDETK